MMRVYAITWVVFAWSFVLYVLWQAVVAARARRQRRDETAASTALRAEGMRVLDGVYDQERDPDPIPTRIVPAPRAPRMDRWT